MLKTIQRVGVLFFFVSSAFAANVETDKMTRLSTLMDKSGINASLMYFPDTLKAIAAQEKPAKCSASREAMSHFSMAVDGAFNAETLAHNMHAKLYDMMSLQDIEAVLAWLNSPLGQKITALEIQAASPQALAATEAQFSTLAQNAARVALLEKFNDATKMVEYTTILSEKMQTSVVKAFIRNGASVKKVSLQALQVDLAKNRSRLRKNIAHEIKMSSLYTYQSLTDAEFKQYIDFLQSPLGQKYHTATIIALSQITAQAGERFGQLLMSIRT